MAEPEYLLSNTSSETAARFTGLAEIFDRVTIDHLRPHVRPGDRCLELGAGSGSIAQWMATAVGPGGRVLATDLDVRWLTPDAAAPYEVLQRDLVTEAVPDGPWDLIHERLLLLHLPARLEVLDRLVAALAPGGWLVLEDFDTAEVRTTDRQGPDHELIAKVAMAFNGLLAGRGAATSFAADVRRLLTERGFEDVSSSGYVAFSAGGTGFAQVLAANARQVAPDLIASGVTAEELERYFRVLDDPTTVVGSSVLITTCARRPGHAPRSAVAAV